MAVVVGCSPSGADEEAKSFVVRSEAAGTATTRPDPTTSTPTTTASTPTTTASTTTASTTTGATSQAPSSAGADADADEPSSTREPTTATSTTSTTAPTTNTPAPTTNPTTTTAVSATQPVAVEAVVDDASGSIRPDWLGRRTLPTTADGRVVVPQTTPDELRNRRFPTIDTLPPPTDPGFAHSVGPVPRAVLARSTWVDGCPVPVDALSYLTVSFWGFDDRPHTGELIVNASAADAMVSVFRTLYEARFPIEEMRVVSMADLGAEPTGDGNNTTSFVCRPVTGGTSFSQHAYGLAIDINPFHNPYLRRDLLLPELAEAYLDRSTPGPGAITAGDVVVQAFADIGWAWGGNWRSLKDYQHFSHNNR